MAPQPLPAEFTHQPAFRLPDDFAGIRSGNLEVSLARTADEIKATQKLRYHIFCNEMGAKPTEEMQRTGCDMDEFDAYCDHLIVVDHDRPTLKQDYSDKIVGTYRLLTRRNMLPLGKFYTESEFDITCLKNYPGEVMELGRSCVDANYRNRAVMQLLFRGIGQYCDQHAIEVMFGCASFHGTDPAPHMQTLSYLHHFHLASPEVCAVPALGRGLVIDYMDKDQIDEKEAFMKLPALIKGYLRIGGVIGNGVVVDEEYNTIDVALVVKTNHITEKYAQRFVPQDTK